jgi:vacuolar-type H+-ATPase subunit H
MANDYTDTLKRIKDIEETSSRELANKKKSLEDELHHLQEDATKSIATAKEEAEAYVAKQADDARSAAQVDADNVLASARKESEAVAAKRLDRKDFRKIVDEMLLAEFKEV